MHKNAFNPVVQIDDLDSKILVGLERISEAYRVLLWEQAKTVGLSPIQIQILIFIRYHPAEVCTVSNLADEFNLTKPTISDAVKILDHKSLILKIPSAADRRAYTIRLTADGKKVTGKTETFSNVLGNIIHEFSPASKVSLFGQVVKIIEALNKRGVLNVQRMCYSCQHFRPRKNGAYCNLIQEKLNVADLRIDCPEYSPR